MAIFEIKSGPMTHEKLMRKTKWDLAHHCMTLYREIERIDSLRKDLLGRNVPTHCYMCQESTKSIPVKCSHGWKHNKIECQEHFLDKGKVDEIPICD